MSKDSQECLAMENFRMAVREKASLCSNKPLTETQKSLIDEAIRKFFTHTATPDHPTYSQMIHRAIRELNEEGGSSEESISNFIRKEYNDQLPWAHSTFLNHHLRKLSESGEIDWTLHDSYLLPGAITKHSSCGSKRKEPKRKPSKKQQKRGKKQEGTELVQSEYQLKEPREVIEEQNRVDDGEKGDGRKLKVVPVESLEPIMEEEKKELGVQPQQQLGLPVAELDQLEQWTQEKPQYMQLWPPPPIAGPTTATSMRQLQPLPPKATRMTESSPSQHQHEQPECQAQVWIPQPKPVMATVVLPSSNQHQQEEQQLGLPVAELDQLEQWAQEKPQHRQFWPPPPTAGPTTATSMRQLQPLPPKATRMTESSSSQHQHEQTECQAQVWIPQPKPVMATVVLPSSNQHQQEEQQLGLPVAELDQLEQWAQEKPQHRQFWPPPPTAGPTTATSMRQLQPLPPKATRMTESSSSQHQHEQPECQAQVWIPQPKPVMATVVLPSSNQHQQEEQQLGLPVAELDQLEQWAQEKPQHRHFWPPPPTAGPTTATSMRQLQPLPPKATRMTESSPSQHQHEQPEGQAQVWIPQPKPYMAAVVQELLPSANQHQQEEQQAPSLQGQGNAPNVRGRGRPKKQQEQQKQQEQPKRRGRPPKPKSTGSIDMKSLEDSVKQQQQQTQP